LDFRGVNQTTDISLDDDWWWEEEILLQRWRHGGGSVDAIESLEGGGGPDDEAAQMSTWGELEEVQCEDGRGLYAGDVAEGARELNAVDFWVVDDEGAAALSVTAATEFTLTCAELSGGLDLVNVCGSTDWFEESVGGGGLGDSCVGEDLGVDDERNFWDRGDLVTAGKEKSWDGRSS
jgi:hypothetical protein